MMPACANRPCWMRCGHPVQHRGSDELTEAHRAHRRYGLLTLLTALIVLASTHLILTISQRPGLPFSIHVVAARTVVLEPIPGIPLPSALHAGDQIDLAALPPATRIAIIRTCGAHAQIDKVTEFVGVLADPL